MELGETKQEMEHDKEYWENEGSKKLFEHEDYRRSIPKHQDEEAMYNEVMASYNKDDIDPKNRIQDFHDDMASEYSDIKKAQAKKDAANTD